MEIKTTSLPHTDPGWERSDNTDRLKAWVQAMAQVQGKVKSIVATNVNNQTKSKFANLDDVLEQVRPIWTEFGFAITFSENIDRAQEGIIHMTMFIMHEEGYVMKSMLRVPYDGAGLQGNVNKTPIQAMGSTITYARRYMTQMALGISIEHDDDGNSGTGRASAKPKSEKASPAMIESIQKSLDKLNIPVEDFIETIANLYDIHVKTMEELDQSDAIMLMKQLRSGALKMQKKENNE